MLEYRDEPPDHPWNPRVCPSLGYIFIHIPKTAGNSIARALEGLTRPPNAPRRTMHKHTKARHLKELLGKDIWESSYRFTVVRNPWDLMVSCYEWWLHTGPRIAHLREMAEQVRALEGFPAFLDSPFGRTMINECPGTMLDWLEVDGRLAVDSCLRFEQLEQDWEKLESRLALGLAPLPHLNRSQDRRPYREYYDARGRALVEERFLRDIAWFDYEF